MLFTSQGLIVWLLWARLWLSPGSQATWPLSSWTWLPFSLSCLLGLVLTPSAMIFVEELVHRSGSRPSFWGLNGFWTECQTSPLLNLPWSLRPVQAQAFGLPSWPPLSSSPSVWFSFALPPMQFPSMSNTEQPGAFFSWILLVCVLRVSRKDNFCPFLTFIFLKKIKDLFGFLLLLSALSHVLVEVSDTCTWWLAEDQALLSLSDLSMKRCALCSFEKWGLKEICKLKSELEPSECLFGEVGASLLDKPSGWILLNPCPSS